MKKIIIAISIILPIAVFGLSDEQMAKRCDNKNTYECNQWRHSQFTNAIGNAVKKSMEKEAERVKKENEAIAKKNKEYVKANKLIINNDLYKYPETLKEEELYLPKYYNTSNTDYYLFVPTEEHIKIVEEYNRLQFEKGNTQ